MRRDKDRGRMGGNGGSKKEKITEKRNLGHIF